MATKAAKKKTILILSDLDARGEDAKVVKGLIESRGIKALLMDFSMEEPPPFPGDITCEQVAQAGGLPIETVREYYRTKRAVATDNQIKGATVLTQELFKKGEIDGVFGMGGATGATIATSIMKTLPFGFPKLMATPVASNPAYISKLVGTKDITMHHTVLDFVKMNPLLEAQVTNAVGAICGMVEMTKGTKFRFDKPRVAVTGFSPAEMTVHKVIDLLAEAGFAPIAVHAAGVGDRAMEEQIREGLFEGVCDISIGGVIEHLFGGNRDPGPGRLTGAAEMGLPQVIAPAGIDHLSYGSRPDLEPLIKSRKHFVMDKLRVQVRTSAEEVTKAADVIAEILNKAKAPFKVLIPLKGFSSLDMEGRACYDPEVDTVFKNRLREKLNNKAAYEEVNLALYTPEFAKKVVDEFVKVYAEYKKTKGAK